MGNSDLSQRGYKHLKKICKQKNIHFPRYDDVIRYMANLDVGEITRNEEKGHTEHMCVSTNLKQTLQLVLSSPLSKMFKFASEEEQISCFEYLKTKNELYKNLDPSKRTIILRQTADNFCATGRHPTEQASFSILNITSLINNPYGQFINCLWRGSETRQNLESHIWMHLRELDMLVSKGIDLEFNGKIEHFNVIVFLVADLALLEKVLG